jgi:hypothetical protein
MRRLLAPVAVLAMTLPATAQEAASELDPVTLRVMVRTEAVKSGMPPEIADAVATVESGYQIFASGDAGEVGLMQILPSTARMLGFYGNNAELRVPARNIQYGVNYLAGAWRLAGGDVCTTVMKYRAGHGEARFSHKSVAYCVRVRQILAEQGYPVRGEVPVATFGAPAVAMAGGRVKTAAGAKGSRIRNNWTAHDRRIKAIESKISRASLTIMQ